MKPWLLVDVDGVLNAFGSVMSDRIMNGEAVFEREFDANGYRIRVPEGTLRRLTKLEEHVRFAWATTWNADAATLIAGEVGIGADWPVIHLPRPLSYRPGTWKLAGVLAWIDTAAAAWIDDDLGDDAHAAFAARAEKFPSLLVQPNPAIGMSDEHVDTIIAWAQSI